MTTHNTPDKQGEAPERIYFAVEDIHDVADNVPVTPFSEPPRGRYVEYVRASVAAPEGDAMRLIATERQRQIVEEGYDAAHDDDDYGHSSGEIAQAAAAYALGAGRIENIDGSRVMDLWPASWGAEDDTIKRKPRLRQLTIAGALIVAEMERLQRLDNAAAASSPHDGFHPAEDVYEATKEFWPAEPLQPTGEQERASKRSGKEGT